MTAMNNNVSNVSAAQARRAKNADYVLDGKPVSPVEYDKRAAITRWPSDVIRGIAVAATSSIGGALTSKPTD